MDGHVGEALAIDGEHVVDVGGPELLVRWPDAEVVDIGERTVAPGLIDAHNHLSLAALQPLWADPGRGGHLTSPG